MKKGWQMKTLGEVCLSISDGDWIEKKDQSEDGIRLVQTGNIGSGVFRDKTASSKFISNETFSRLRCSEIFEGDVLISRLPDPIGRACILPKLNTRAITAVDCSIVRLAKSCYCPYFVYYSQCQDYLRAVKKLSTGTTRLRISRKNLSQVSVPIPPLEEQKRIVAILDSKFAAIDAIQNNATKSMEQAEAMWQATLKHELCQRNGWSIKTLGEVSTCARGLTYSKKDEALHSHNVVLRSNNVDLQTHCLDLSELKHLNEGLEIPADKKVKKGSLLICLSNGSKSHLGKVAIVDKDYGYAFGGFMGLLSPSEEILTKYLFYNMISLEYKSYIKSLSDGSNINNLKLKDLSAFPISLPSLEEQKRIVESLDRASASIAELKANCTQIISHCTALKQALLRQAFNGEL